MAHRSVNGGVGALVGETFLIVVIYSRESAPVTLLESRFGGESRNSLLEQPVKCHPEDFRWNCFAEPRPLVAVVAVLRILVLEMQWAKLWMVVVSVPPTIESGIRIGVVNPIERFLTGESPFDSQRRCLRSGGRNDTVGIDFGLQIPFGDTIWLVDDVRGDRMAFQHISESLVD
jgi:hypothetical protein